MQKPTDLDLHCLLRQGTLCLAREELTNVTGTLIKRIQNTIFPPPFILGYYAIISYNISQKKKKKKQTKKPNVYFTTC